ncbi:copper amine oxidase N-terminal domain-containing protein [Paenibacillus wulumuqiensis]|uniref:copper amine oxidase N-terminal domain-containing protein n=1 Tax=Paenibacillus wulumuqiensis TaxID=1567107 RepID=UPI000619B6B7|nr:copper amine oxidase N-terminal domain-containing protein [Paenibacillus wulumuqiensis]
MKKTGAILLLVLIICTTVSNLGAGRTDAASVIQIYGNHGLIAPAAAPYIHNGTVMIPVDAIRKLDIPGVTLSWNPQQKKAIIKQANQQISIIVTRPFIEVNGQRLQSAEKATFQNGRIFVPVRVIVEALGEPVVWNAENRIVAIGRAVSTTN